MADRLRVAKLREYEGWLTGEIRSERQALRDLVSAEAMPSLLDEPRKRLLRLESTRVRCRSDIKRYSGPVAS